MSVDMNIAVLGDRDSVLGFSALGLAVHTAESADEARGILHTLAADGLTAVIYITEQLCAELATDIARYADATIPALIPIPGKTGSLGLGMDAIKQAIERAVGADIIGDA